MSPGLVFFAFCTITCVVGALATVTAKNPIRGAVGLLASILGIAGLFLKLSAQFLAAIQLIVYAGAVVVLFVFVIMLLGSDATGVESGPTKAKVSRGIAGALLALLAGAALALLGRAGGPPTRFGVAPAEHGTVEAVGGKLFTDGIVPFELATALLIVAVIGAIAVARGKQSKTRAAARPADDELFHGPLLPRDDRGRPPEKAAEPTPGHGGHG